MPRSNWKGVISFGLVTIPITLYPSEKKSSVISFHQIDKRNNARIKYKRINSETGKEVEWNDIARGYEYDKDITIPVPEEVLKKVAGEQGRQIEIESFVDKKDLDMLTLENVYYLVPDKNGEKGYVILREALTATNKIGIAKVIISTKEYLSAIMAHDNALVLCLLKYDEELNKASAFDLPDENLKKYRITAKEIEIAKQLIKSMTKKWDPKKYKDDYQQAIHQWVEETVRNLPHKLKGKQTKKATKSVDFIDLLKKSLATKNGKRRGKHKVVKPKSKHAHQGKVLH